jgi:hypothetical protein
MEQIPSWEANRSSASKEILHILWNQKVQYHIHKHLPSVPVLSQISPVTALHPTSSRSVLVLFSHLSLGLGITSPFSIVYVTPNDHSNSEALWNGKFLWLGVVALCPTPGWQTSSCWLCTTAYSIYSQLPSISGGHSSNHNLRTPRAVATGTHLSREDFP